MEIEEFYKLLLKNVDISNIVLNDKQKNQFFEYMQLLIEWNEKINLTAITDPSDIVMKHFIDSTTILKYIDDNNKIIDVGTGAGFPGIPIKIANNTLDITLLDSLNKRMVFLNDVIEKLGLEKIATIHSRVEDFGRKSENREKYDRAVSRAVAKLNILSEYMLPLIKVGGYCICMKGPDIEDELEQSNNAIQLLGGKVKNVEKFVLPNTDMGRSIVVIEKVSSTPNKYPRKAGIPSKEPL